MVRVDEGSPTEHLLGVLLRRGGVREEEVVGGEGRGVGVVHVPGHVGGQGGVGGGVEGRGGGWVEGGGGALRRLHRTTATLRLELDKHDNNCSKHTQLAGCLE